MRMGASCCQASPRGSLMPGWSAMSKNSTPSAPPPDFRTASDLPRERVYGPEHLPDFAESIGEPGVFPFTRGLHATGYRGRRWTMRQYAGFGTAAESNRRYRYLLGEGTTGLSVAFDLPTQIGYDSDDPHSAGEVGRVGVAIDSLEDMETLLEGDPRSVPLRDGPERHPQGIRGPGDVHLPTRPVAPPRDRPLRLLRGAGAEVEPDLDLGLPHPRGGGHRPGGDRVHLRPRPRVRAGGPGGRPPSGPLRGAAQLLLRLPLGLHRGGGEVPGRAAALGPAHEGALLRHQPEGPAAALPRADGGRHPDRAAARQQRRAGGPPGPGRRAGRLPEPAHEREGRGAGPAHRGLGPARPAHTADHRLRVRGGGHRGPARRRLRGGGRDRPPREGGAAKAR